MKNVGLAVAALILASCTSVERRKDDKTAETAVKKHTLIVLHQSNRLGEIEPCGCHENPYGGIDREANAVHSIRQEGRGKVLYVDSGNALVKPGKKITKDRAMSLAKMLDAAGLEILSPGPNEYRLGMRALKAIRNEVAFTFLSTNIVGENGESVFQPYVIEVRDGLRVGVISLTPSLNLEKGYRVVAPEEALAKVLAEIKPKTDMVVVLSQLGNAADEKLASEFDVSLVVGADSLVSTQSPRWVRHGKALVVDNTLRGQRLGRLDLQIALPFRGFTSAQAIAENLEEITTSEKLLASRPHDEGLRKYIELLKTERPVEDLSGGSYYIHELIQLDEARYGEPNKVTKLISDEKERIRSRALAE